MVRTKQRELILTAIRETDAHPTADELFQSIRPQMPMISLATVYRNLNYLANEGVIRKLEMPGMPDRFDRRIEPHDHLVCDACGRVLDLDLPCDLSDEIARAAGTKISGYSLVARGLCPRCREA